MSPQLSELFKPNQPRLALWAILCGKATRSSILPHRPLQGSLTKGCRLTWHYVSHWGKKNRPLASSQHFTVTSVHTENDASFLIAVASPTEVVCSAQISPLCPPLATDLPSGHSSTAVEVHGRLTATRSMESKHSVLWSRYGREWRERKGKETKPSKLSWWYMALVLGIQGAS